MSAEAELEGFLAKYSAEIADQMRAARSAMQARLPGAVELVYDNYNALVIGYGATERSSDAVFSLAAYPRWVNLFFFDAADLADPAGLLQGSGSSVRRITLEDAATLDSPAVRALIDEALRRAKAPLDPSAPGRLVIKSVSTKQRPRRPS
jgi:hypothetical protein